MVISVSYYPFVGVNYPCSCECYFEAVAREIQTWPLQCQKRTFSVAWMFWKCWKFSNNNPELYYTCKEELFGQSCYDFWKHGLTFLFRSKLRNELQEAKDSYREAQRKLALQSAVSYVYISFSATTGFVWVMENLEIHAIEVFQFLETWKVMEFNCSGHGKSWKIIPCVVVTT